MHPAIRQVLRRIALIAGAAPGLYLVRRAIAELFVIHWTGPAGYRNDWGCPRLAGLTGGGLEIRPKPATRTENGREDRSGRGLARLWAICRWVRRCTDEQEMGCKVMAFIAHEGGAP